MRVKNTYFVELCPGLPVYEMENGDFRLPFPNFETKQMIYCTENEMLKGITDPTPERIENVKVIFQNIRLAVCKSVAPEMLIHPEPKKPILKSIN